MFSFFWQSLSVLLLFTLGVVPLLPQSVPGGITLSRSEIFTSQYATPR